MGLKQGAVALAGAVVTSGIILATVLTGGGTAGAASILGWAHFGTTAAGQGTTLLAAGGGFVGVTGAMAEMTVAGVAAATAIGGAAGGAFSFLCHAMAFHLSVEMYADMEKWQFRLGYVPGGICNTKKTKNLRLVVLVKIEKIEMSDGAASKITNTNYAYIEEIGVPDRKNKNKYKMEHKIKFKLYGLVAGTNRFSRAIKAP